ELARGESKRVGDTEVRFVEFDLNVNGNAIAQMASGKPVTIGAVVELTRNGRTSRVRPLYRMNLATREVEAPPALLPEGGAIMVAGINASDRKVQLALSGLAVRAKLSLDITRKPLIKAVWWGLYIVLAGGLLSMSHRIRGVRLRDRLAAERGLPGS